MNVYCYGHTIKDKRIDKFVLVQRIESNFKDIFVEISWKYVNHYT